MQLNVYHISQQLSRVCEIGAGNKASIKTDTGLTAVPVPYFCLHVWK